MIRIFFVIYDRFDKSTIPKQIKLPPWLHKTLQIFRIFDNSKQWFGFLFSLHLFLITGLKLFLLFNFYLRFCHPGCKTFFITHCVCFLVTLDEYSFVKSCAKICFMASHNVTWHTEGERKGGRTLHISGRYAAMTVCT